MLQSIEQQIWYWAETCPNKIAVKSSKTSVTYQELVKRILGAKAYFQSKLGCSHGETVIIAAGKQLEFVYASFGAHLAGLKVVPIDVATNFTRLTYIVEYTQASLLIGFNTSELDIQKVSLKLFAEAVADYSVPEFPDMENVSDILFTTGTTGQPKGVPLTFANVSAAARNINAFIGNTHDDVELLALPVSHSFGLGRVRCCLSKGATLILLGSFANVKRIYKTMEEDNVTGFTMVPASWRYLKKLSGLKLGDFASQLKYIEMGSAFLSEDEKKELADLLPCTRVCMHYGLTEASRSAFMEFHKDAACLNSVGKASPFTDIKIVDENGEECLESSEGEICVKGAHVMHGYLDMPMKESFYRGYFRTGDWGYKTKEGYVYLVSRKKELINVGGKKVSPIEVEEQLCRIDGIEDCACIGVSDEEGILGEVVKAFIVKRHNCDLSFEEIAKRLYGNLESYKFPVVYQWIDEIPKTQNGKIQRNVLK